MLDSISMFLQLWIWNIMWWSNLHWVSWVFFLCLAQSTINSLRDASRISPRRLMMIFRAACWKRLSAVCLTAHMSLVYVSNLMPSCPIRDTSRTVRLNVHFVHFRTYSSSTTGSPLRFWKHYLNKYLCLKYLVLIETYKLFPSKIVPFS